MARFRCPLDWAIHYFHLPVLQLTAGGPGEPDSAVFSWSRFKFFFSNNFSKISLASYFISLQKRSKYRLQKKRSQVFDFDTNYLLFCYFFSGDFWRECVALFSDLFLLSHGNIAFRRAKIERRAHLQSLFFRYHALLSPTLSVSH